MKTIMIYRRDFKETAEANFFEDILEELGNTTKTVICGRTLFELQKIVNDYIYK